MLNYQSRERKRQRERVKERENELIHLVSENKRGMKTLMTRYTLSSCGNNMRENIVLFFLLSRNLVCNHQENRPVKLSTVWNHRREPRQPRRKGRTHRQVSALQANPRDSCWRWERFPEGAGWTGLSGSLSQTRGKACPRGRAMRAEAWLEVLTCSVWKTESRDGSGESGGLSRRGVEGKYEG